MRIFHEDHNNFYREISLDYENLKSKDELASVDSNKRIYVQLSVSYSQSMDDANQITRLFKHFSLTLSKCWLITTENNNSNVHQILIENG